MARRHKCIVMTADGIPIAKISPERAIVLVMQKKAYLIRAEADNFFRSRDTVWPVPVVVGLTRYYKLPAHFYSHARLTINALEKRDEYTCQYCGRHKNQLGRGEILTRDHVFPQSRGGEDRWENVVLACVTCNNQKGDRTPEEAHMPLLKRPFAPNRWQLNYVGPEVWDTFIAAPDFELDLLFEDDTLENWDTAD